MKTTFILLSFVSLLIAMDAMAQSGINTTTPAATLDVQAKNANGSATGVDGLLIPRVDRQRAQSMASVPASTLIYVNDISTGTATGATATMDAVGYYYSNGTAWIKLNSGANNIYNTNGTLTGNRTVTQGANTLAFTSTAVNGFSVDGTTLSVDAANHRLGLGTAAPQTTAHILSAGTGGTGVFAANTANMALRLENAGNGQAVIQHLLAKDASGAVKQVVIGVNPTYNGGSGAFNLSRDGSNDFVMDLVNGNIGIGSLPNASYKLAIGGNVYASGTFTPSDIRIKKEVTDNVYGLKEILNLRTINYRYKDEQLSKDKKLGFVAQDIKAAMPELVTTANDEMKTLSVNYPEMTVVLTKAIQELQEMVKQQQKEINSLKEQINTKK